MITSPQAVQYLKQIGVDCVFSNKAIDYTKVQKSDIKESTKKTTTILPTPQSQKKDFSSKTNDDLVLQLKNCTTLDALYDQVRNYKDCPLQQTALNTVFSDGQKNASIMIIGEAPGAEEDEAGKPFVGKSGQLIDTMFKSIGLSRDKNLYITNMIFWRPPGNRPPTEAELAQCYPFLERHILIFKPKIILLLGGIAAKVILKTKEGIITLRGKAHDFRHPELENPIPVVPFYHPAYLLRSPSQKGVFWQDLLFLQSVLEEKKLI